MRSPCCPSFTLGWVCFWPAVSQAFVGCEGGLGCPSWFVTALGSWTPYSDRWMVQVPAVFLSLTLGSSLSLPVLAAGFRWLRFILGCPPSIASLWRVLTWFFVRYLLACPHGAAVPLASAVRSPISGPVGVLPQSTTVALLSLLWLGLLLAFVRFHYLRLTL